MNFEKFLYKKISLWVLLIVILFSIIFSLFFGALVLRSETAQKIVLIPKNIKMLFSDEYDLGFVSERFKNKKGLTLKKNLKFFKTKYLLLSRYSGDEQRSVVELISLYNGKKIHEWKPNFDEINKESNLSKDIINFKRDHNNQRYQMIHPYLLNNGDLFYHSIYQSPLVKIDICSNLISTLDMFTHHSIESDGDGLWTPITYLPSKNNPGLDENKGTKKTFFYDDGLLKVNYKNEKTFEKSFIEILVENELSHLVFDGGIPFHDPLHLNDIQPVLVDSDYFKKGDLFLSFRNISTIFLYRHSINKIIWYKKFPWEFQHDVDIIDDRRITIFNNNRLRSQLNKKIKFNDLIIYDFEKDEIEYILKKKFNEFKIQTMEEGLAEVLKNDSVFIEETSSGRIIILDKNGQKILEYINRAKNNKLYRLNWSRIVDLNIDIFNQNLKEKNCLNE